MIPTGTPQTLRPARIPFSATYRNAGRCLTALGIICALAAAGMSETRADDSAAAQPQQEGQEYKAASPPLADDAVPPPPEGELPPAEDVPDSVEGFPGRLPCDDCCPGCDQCCPGFDACCPLAGGSCCRLHEDLCCFEPGCDGCDALWGCTRADATFYFGTEFGVLRPEVDRLRGAGTANPSSLKPDHSFEFAPRFFGGFQTCEGWGGQISYWELETGASRTNLPQVLHDLDLQTVDVELTRTCEAGEWSIQLGAGGRWGDIESSYFSLVSPNQRLTTNFEGTGPTAVLNLRRPLGSGNWALVGEGRASFLYGNTSVDAPLAPGLQIGDEWVDIWEGRAGVEWTGPSASGNALFFVRALFEGQYWNVPSVGPAGSPDLNFLGPTLSVGFVF